MNGTGFPSPNFGARREGARPELVVLHFTAMQSAAAARERLCDPGAEVSAHWLIDRHGKAEQLVDEAARAWHAGVGSWGGRGDVNSRSIGIELANPGDRPFPEPQMVALERLLAGILQRWQIPAAGVIGHSDMAPGRKSDPGPKFDWRRLALGGLSVWPRSEGGDGDADPVAFRAALIRFGYPEAEDDLLLEVFRLRFRPWGRGALSPEDCRVAAGLPACFPVDGTGAAP